MNLYFLNSIRPVTAARMLFFWSAFILFLGFCSPIWAHPMPNSIVLLDLKSGGISGELQLPLNELELAFGHEVNKDPATLVARLGAALKVYLQEHIQPTDPDNRPWMVDIGDLTVQTAAQDLSGAYHELIVPIWMQPPPGASVRDFIFHYDVIIHQVVTHTALVRIRQDWERGITAERPAELGVIGMDIPSATVLPMVVRQSGSGWWGGFRGMLHLGMRHIAEGTDHLLFLLTLLLVAPLFAVENHWESNGRWRYSLLRLLKIVTAFTMGHSLTLLAGAVGWLRLPSQPVEILIALSILVSAVHAIRPVFPNKETYVAAGFGLVHGLAFAGTLIDLSLDKSQMAISILGFNLGIEAMQILVVAVTVPSLILLSQGRFYRPVRLIGAAFAAVAAGAWILQRSTAQPNPITLFVENTATHAYWLVLFLACLAFVSKR